MVYKVVAPSRNWAGTTTGVDNKKEGDSAFYPSSVAQTDSRRLHKDAASSHLARHPVESGEEAMLPLQ